MKFIKFIKDLKERRKEQTKIKKCDELKKIIKNYEKVVPEKDFLKKALYIGPEIPSEIIEPIINDMGLCIIERRDYFENTINLITNRQSHELFLMFI